MTTAREVKTLVAPLLARHPEMSLVGRAIVVGPVRHLMHLIFIDATSSADVCQPHWGVVELFVKHETMSLGVGERLLGLWRLSEPGLGQRLVEEVEKVALRNLAPVKSIRDYLALAFPSEGHRRGWVLAYLRGLLAAGDLAEARDILRSGERVGWWSDRLASIGVLDNLISLGNGLGQADRAKIAALLHEWEAYSVAKLKIGHLWEPTPFPLETTRP